MLNTNSRRLDLLRIARIDGTNIIMYGGDVTKGRNAGGQGTVLGTLPYSVHWGKRFGEMIFLLQFDLFPSFLHQLEFIVG